MTASEMQVRVTAQMTDPVRGIITVNYANNYGVPELDSTLCANCPVAGIQCNRFETYKIFRIRARFSGVSVSQLQARKVPCLT